ncbi:hypothetical protein CTAYLR_004785 [Chrysophaeum taylorii]|uniref:intramembrane prenyl-peptidase Rce1 n=1 Tax=Chrysophaeum taylorii TaxID=2483200 RepID=A0AAD7UMS4_9STRA|nr:hypothetical protein CTAYLR_004785 [Chrysophaeum taylorii]
MSSCCLSERQAIAWSLAMSSSFVGSLYLVPLRWRRLHRDEPAHVRARFVAVAAATSASLWAFAVVTRSGECFGGLARALGASDSSQCCVKSQQVAAGPFEVAKATIASLALTASLYLGQIAASATVALRFGIGPRRVRWPSTVAVRNLLVGPVSEEIVFRACMVPLLLEAGFSLPRAVFVSPLFFGVAHLHHLKRHIVEDRMSVAVALAHTALQFAYTTLFGIFTAFLFVRTAHLAAAVASHVFCNYAGLPDLGFLWPPAKRDLRWLSARDRAAAVFLHSHKPALLAAYGFGILLFALSLFPLTGPTLFASPFWPPPRSSSGDSSACKKTPLRPVAPGSLLFMPSS